MTVVVSRGFRWIADKDRITHAVRDRGRQTRTLCGIPATDERFAQPAAMRCERCEEVADGKTT